MSSQPGLRQQKKQATKRLLVKTAHQLFAEKGYEATTFDDIAAASEISRRTIFRYFPTKESIVFADHDNRLNGFLQALSDAPPQTSPLEKLLQAFVVLSKSMMRDKRELLAQRHLVMQSPSLTAYESALDSQWETAAARILDPECGQDEQPDFNARVLAGAKIGGVRAALQVWEESDGTKDLTELGLNAISLIKDNSSL
jgi:AcrR family transcriptional regulator